MAALRMPKSSSSNSERAAAAVDVFFSRVTFGKCFAMNPEHCPRAYREVNSHRTLSIDVMKHAPVRG